MLYPATESNWHVGSACVACLCMWLQHVSKTQHLGGVDFWEGSRGTVLGEPAHGKKHFRVEVASEGMSVDEGALFSASLPELWCRNVLGYEAYRKVCSHQLPLEVAALLLFLA
mmetsp:Transcript_160412/g.510445  ORF Transcript_160412/g.510445 Transcript_160412/m.510445 type:complete len:113 (+) Transcript_160412:342-680(+)